MSATATTDQTFSTSEDRRKLLARLARVEGQLRGIQRMITDGKECEPIAQQLAAARGGLNRAFTELIACAFETKLSEGPECPPEVRAKVREFAGMLARYG